MDAHGAGVPPVKLAIRGSVNSPSGAAIVRRVRLARLPLKLPSCQCANCMSVVCVSAGDIGGAVRSSMRDTGCGMAWRRRHTPEVGVTVTRMTHLRDPDVIPSYRSSLSAVSILTRCVRRHVDQEARSQETHTDPSSTLSTSAAPSTTRVLSSSSPTPFHFQRNSGQPSRPPPAAELICRPPLAASLSNTHFTRKTPCQFISRGALL